MTDREKLIALIKEGECGALALEDCSYCKYDGEDDCSYQLLADVLLANGVVVREKGEWDIKRRHHGGFRRYTGRDDFGEEHTITVDERSECDEPYCPKCGKWNESVWRNFCPNCGADMRKGENG